MADERSKLSQGWVSYDLGKLYGQQEELLKKIGAIIELHEKVRKGEVTPATTDIYAGLEELVEVTKKYQNNASMLMAHVMMWRLDWRLEHNEEVEKAKVVIPKEGP